MTCGRQIVINGRFLDQSLTGVQRYAWGISSAIDELVAARHPIVHDVRVSIARPSRGTTTFPYRHIEEARFGRLNGHAWEQLELPLYSKDAPLLNLCNTSPLLGRNNLTVVHDANVWLMPDNYSRAFRAVYKILLPLGIRRSRAWVTVSNYSADQLLKRRIAHRPPDAIIGNGSDHILALSGETSEMARIALPRPYALALGSRSRNKNIEMIRLLAPQLAAAGISIVIAGDIGSNIFTKQEAMPQSNIVELGRVTDNDLVYLMRNCLCFVFPSFFEGFGIPPLEAMVLGAPVVSSNTASMPEILRDAALYCPPDTPDAWIATILRLAADAPLRSALIARGRERAAKYVWKTSAVHFMDLARQLINSSEQQRRQTSPQSSQVSD
jgi:glycosyltransferase involved in cell wall biosynthesis